MYVRERQREQNLEIGRKGERGRKRATCLVTLLHAVFPCPCDFVSFHSLSPVSAPASLPLSSILSCDVSASLFFGHLPCSFPSSLFAPLPFYPHPPPPPSLPLSLSLPLSFSRDWSAASPSSPVALRPNNALRSPPVPWCVFWGMDGPRAGEEPLLFGGARPYRASLRAERRRRLHQPHTALYYL